MSRMVIKNVGALHCRTPLHIKSSVEHLNVRTVVQLHILLEFFTNELLCGLNPWCWPVCILEVG